MSDTASLELSRELFELSGWDNTPAGGKERWVELPDNSWDCLRLSDVEANGLDRQLWFNGIPSFSAGYLLRKLYDIDDPDNGTPENIYVELTVVHGFSTATSVRGITRVDADQPHQRRLPSCDADTPENALCKLAIELIKEGILPISGRDL